MNEQYLGPITKAIRFGIVGLAFLTPLFFLPITSEFYQFNKQYLVVVAAIILLALWGLRCLLEGKLKIVSNPFNIALLIFAVSFVAATFFSVDQYVSLVGAYPRFHGGLISLLSYLAIFFVAVNNLDKDSRNATLLALLASGLVLAIGSVLSFFGYHLLTASYAQSRTWTPIGNLSSLSLYLALSLPIGLGFLFSSKKPSLQIIFLIASCILLTPILLLGYAGPIIALVIAGFAALFFLPKTKIDKQTRNYLLVFGGVAIGIFLFTYVPTMRQNLVEPLTNSNLHDQLKNNKTSFFVDKEKNLPLNSAWQISTQAVGQRPFFGVGPGTFAYSFTSFKGLEMNSNDFWNLRFDLSGNEYLTLLSTLGILGLLAFLFLLFTLARNLFNFNYQSTTVDQNPMSVFLFASLVVFIIAIFFQDTTASVWFFFVLLAASSYSFLKDVGVKGVEEVTVKLVALNAGGLQFVSADSTSAKKDKTFGTILLITAAIGLAALLYYGLPMYQAEMSYQKALNASSANKAADTHDFLASAISQNPYRDTYHRSLLVLDRILAINLSKQTNRTDQDNKNLAGLVNEAMAQGIIVTGYESGGNVNSYSIRQVPGSSPLNVANWEAFSDYLSSLDLTGDLKTKNAIDAINVAKQAVNLDPKNPLLYESLGNILLKNNLVDLAIQSYQSAINVKPDYASTHYDLANAIRQKGSDPNTVVTELQNTLSLLPSSSADRDRVQKELKDAQDKLNSSVAGVATGSAKPSGKK